MNRAPWADFNGQPIHEGDTIEHPSGECGTVVFLAPEQDPGDQWRVDYGNGDLSRLGLQIGDKGQAVVRPTRTEAMRRYPHPDDREDFRCWVKAPGPGGRRYWRWSKKEGWLYLTLNRGEHRIQTCLDACQLDRVILGWRWLVAQHLRRMRYALRHPVCPPPPKSRSPIQGLMEKGAAGPGIVPRRHYSSSTSSPAAMRRSRSATRSASRCRSASSSWRHCSSRSSSHFR